jgi:hypothetical protein
MSAVGTPASRTVAIDWSGARIGAHRHLWIAEWDPLRGVVAEVKGASRDEAVAHLLRLGDWDGELLVGLDFNFSFPDWWLDTCAIEGPEELWADSSSLESWLAECPAPFWGRPGRRRPELTERQHFRATELAAPLRPKSVFQIGGAGAVGTASLRGMPALAVLRRAGFRIWPFHEPASGSPMVAEVWPRLAAPHVIKRRPESRHNWLQQHTELLTTEVVSAAERSDDAFDAVAAVIDLAQRGRNAHPLRTEPLLRREGWISGVPLPAHASRSKAPGSRDSDAHGSER